MQYSEKELSQLIDQVKQELTACLNKAEVEDKTLAKSEDGEKPEHKEEPKHEEHEEHHEHEAKEHGDHEEGHKDHEGHEEHGEHEGHDYDEEDMMHMEKMYRSMSKGELKAHSDCISKCMGGSPSMAKAEIEQETPGKIPGAKSEASKAHGEVNKSEHANGGEMEGCEPGKIPGAKSEASDAHGKEINKAEIEACPPGKTPGAKSEASDAHGKEINKSMEKSENTGTDLLKSENDTLKSENAQLKKNFEAVEGFLKKLVEKTAPQGKAITSLDVIAKSETHSEEKTITKKEITEILTKKASDPLLKSEDREAINKYYLSGQVNVNGISHLLK